MQSIQIADQTDRAVCAVICRSSGIRAREIAKALNPDRAAVNHVLYRSPLMKELCWQDGEYRWHGIMRQARPHSGLSEFSGYYGLVREFLLLAEDEWMQLLTNGCTNIGRNLNDTRGHAAGDEALTAIAQCLTQASKAHQSVYRIGGDEFLVICRKNTLDDVLQLIKRIRKNVSDTGYSISIGYSCTEDRPKSISEMMKESDEMMYTEKASYYKVFGKDRRRN